MDDAPDNEETFEEADEDFSLDQLSRAYAEVMREKHSDGGSVVLPDSVADDSLSQRTGESDSVSPETESFVHRDAIENKQDNAPCGITPESIIEAILFVGAPRGSSLRISQIAGELRDVSEAEILTHISDLNQKYASEKCAFEIAVEQDVVEMILVESLAELKDEFYGRNKQFQLSQPAIDVLSVVAYNQPITKEQVEIARGKPSGSILAQLVRRNLLCLDLDEPKPSQRTYATTDRFLEMFHLTAIEDLPQSHDVSEFEEYID
jgi:segregation and condensation protein B